MAMESAVAFYGRLEHDKELMERIRTLETPERIEPYVKGELGYDFTWDEMQRVIFAQHPEMTDEELERVTGGGQGIEIVLQMFMSLLAAAA